MWLLNQKNSEVIKMITNLLNKWARYNQAKSTWTILMQQRKFINKAIAEKAFELNDMFNSFKDNEEGLTKEEVRDIYNLHNRLEAYSYASYRLEKAIRKIGNLIHRKKYIYLYYTVNAIVTLSPVHCWEE
jgi:hypothetical protein